MAGLKWIFDGQRERSEACSESNGQYVTPSSKPVRFAAIAAAIAGPLWDGDGVAGVGDDFERIGLWEHGWDLGDQPASAARAAVYGEGQTGHSPVHERRAGAGGYV